MDEIGKELKKKYAEEIAGLVRPQHFLLFFCAAIVIETCVFGDETLYGWIWSQSIGTALKDTLLSVKIGIIFIAIAFVALNAWLYKIISGELFDLFSGAHEFQKFLEQSEGRLTKVSASNKKKLIKIIEKEVSDNRKLFNFRARSSELLFGASILFLLSWSVIDGVVFILGVVGFGYFSYKNYIFFIEKLSPAQCLLAVLEAGKDSVRDYFSESKK